MIYEPLTLEADSIRYQIASRYVVGASYPNGDSVAYSNEFIYQEELVRVGCLERNPSSGQLFVTERMFWSNEIVQSKMMLAALTPPKP